MNTSTNAGEPIRACELHGFTLTERWHEPNWVLAPHAHAVTILGVTLAGGFDEAIGRHQHACESGSLQILPAGESHLYRFGSSRVHCLTIEVKPEKLAQVRLFSDVLERSGHFSGREMRGFLARLYQEFKAGDAAAGLSIEGVLLETLGAVTRDALRCQSPVPPVWLRRALDFLHEHFAAGVSLTELAAFVEVHPSHLTRMFRRYYGCSVGDYVLRLRLEYAAHELGASDQSLAEIAVAAGFYDQSHFTHAFKARLKMTPAEYRAVVRSNRR